jgi:hypothetical protein
MADIRLSGGDRVSRLASRALRGLLDTLQADGDELAIHTHAWRWDERAGHRIADHGSLWMNEWTPRLLDRLGFRCDLSVGPASAVTFCNNSTLRVPTFSGH